MLRSALALSAVLLVSTSARAAAQQPFTLDDVLTVASADVQGLSSDGRHVVVASADLRARLGVDSHRTGDPTYVSPAAEDVWLVDTRTGNRTAIFPGAVNLISARFSPNSQRIALVVHEGDDFRLGIYDVGGARLRWQTLPGNARLAGEQGASPRWTEDGNRLLLAIRPQGWLRTARTEFARLTEGPVTVHRGDDPFLAWEALRRMGSQVEIVSYDPGNGRQTAVVPTTTLARGGFEVAGQSVVFDADVTEKTSYDVIFGVTAEVRTTTLEGGAARVVTTVPEDRRLTWSDDHRTYAYADKGDIYRGSLQGEPVRLTGSESSASDSTPSGDDADRERFSVVGISPHGSWVVASSKTGIWLIDASSKERTRIAEKPEDEDEARFAPSYDLRAWSPDESQLYFETGSKTQWERGMMRYDVARAQRTELFSTSRLQGGFQLSEDGSTFVFNAADGNRPFDIYAASADFSDPRRVVESNPQLADRALGRTELIDYLDVDGERLHGVLYYPPGYREGTRVPTIFLVYETFFDDRFNSTIALLNSAGYAVVQPSVDLEIGFPGEAWMKGVTAAANRLIERGIADPDKLGVHGTSYGGYATNLLITQTNRFAAAINISGKVDMISFYTDSPRLGVRNIHAPENSQDRIGATLWEQPQKYIDHSAIMAADRIETPLLLMTGEQDHNVPERTTMEMYYALRRLGKTVEWVSYKNGGHGMPRTTETEVRDYHERILAWYDRWLKDGGKAATDQGGH